MFTSKQTDQASIARLASQNEAEVHIKDTLAKMLAEEERISFYSVAARANIARSTLYRNKTLKSLVVRARNISAQRNQPVSKLDELRTQITQLEAALLNSKNECLVWKKKTLYYQRQETFSYYSIDFEGLAA